MRSVARVGVSLRYDAKIVLNALDLASGHPFMRHTCPVFAPTPFGRLLHARSEKLARHCHSHPFAAVVLSGRYLEAGDQGRRTVASGEVLIHGPYESHLDRFSPEGAEVLIVPIAAHGQLAPFGRHPDPDLVAREAEKDLAAAAALLLERFEPVANCAGDWPDMLASLLRERSAAPLTQWAHTMQLRPETVSRGFKAAYGVSPSAYRANARARAALARIFSSAESFAGIAAALDFADQAHLSRSIVRLTGHPPSFWRTKVQ